MKLGPLIKISAQRISEVVDGDPPFYVCKCKSKRERERERVRGRWKVWVWSGMKGGIILKDGKRERERVEQRLSIKQSLKSD